MLKGVSIKPNRTSAHTDTPLTNLLVAHYQADEAFIADKVFPTLPVSRSTDIFYEVPRGAMNRLQMQERARGAKPTQGGFDYKKQTYSCDIYALKVGVTDEDEIDFDNVIEWDNEATNFLALQCKLNREITWNNKFFKEGVWGTDKAGVDATPSGQQFLQWNDAGSDPINDIKSANVEMLRRTGFMANTLTLPYEVYSELTEHPDVIDRVKYGQTAGLLAAAPHQRAITSSGMHIAPTACGCAQIATMKRLRTSILSMMPMIRKPYRLIWAFTSRMLSHNYPIRG